VQLQATRRVYAESFSKPQSLDGPRLWVAGHSDFGEVRFDPPGGRAYSQKNGHFVLQTYAALDGLHGGLVQSVSASQAYKGSAGDEAVGFTCAGCYWEARIRFTSAPGTWGAFWLLSPDDPRNRGHLEVDVIEYYGLGDPRGHHHSLHRWEPSEPEGHAANGDYTGLDTISDDGWHTYGVDLRGHARIRGRPAIVFTMDGKELVRVKAEPDYLTKPFYYVLSLSIHAKGRSSLKHSTMTIDYVHAYRDK
jgi:hypothetical protein